MECLIQHGCQDITADLDPNVENNYIARGGFGIIYSGHLHDRRPVAIKCLEVLNNQSWAEDGYSVDLKVLSSAYNIYIYSTIMDSTQHASFILGLSAVTQHSYHFLEWRGSEVVLQWCPL